MHIRSEENRIQNILTFFSNFVHFNLKKLKDMFSLVFAMHCNSLAQKTSITFMKNKSQNAKIDL